MKPKKFRIFVLALLAFGFLTLGLLSPKRLAGHPEDKHVVVIDTSIGLLKTKVSITPESLTIPIGDTVIWENRTGQGLLTGGYSFILSSQKGGFEKKIQPGKSQSFTFEKPGRYRVRIRKASSTQQLLGTPQMADPIMEIEVIGTQEVSLIYSPSRIYPTTVSLKAGFPVKIYNTSLQGKQEVILPPFIKKPFTVQTGSVKVIQFTPEKEGKYQIKTQEGITAWLIVGKE